MSNLAQELQIDPMEMAASRYVATLFNMLPIEIIESKPGLFPTRFLIPPGSVSEDGTIIPGIMIVGEAYHFIDNVLIEQGKPGSTFRQTTNPNVMANSLVNDYKYAHIALGEDAEPGLFWLPGRVEIRDIIGKNADPRYNALYKQTVEKHKRWYRNLIALADADWEKNHNMLAVSDLQRMAARFLKVQKEWVEFTAVELLNCPMCAVAVNATAVLCSSCNFILKPDLYEANKGRFAGSVPPAAGLTNVLGGASTNVLGGKS